MWGGFSILGEAISLPARILGSKRNLAILLRLNKKGSLPPLLVVLEVPLLQLRANLEGQEAVGRQWKSE